MAREMAPVNMTSSVSEIVEVHSDVLFDLLVVLTRVAKAVPPSSPLEGVCIIKMLVGEAASAGVAIRSWGGRSANRAHRV